MSKSRSEMISYLQNHFRYPTAHNWSKETSYAINVKLCKMKFPNAKIKDFAYDCLGDPIIISKIQNELRNFAIKYNWQYQIYFNGRSNGYLVLYQGGKVTRTSPNTGNKVCHIYVLDKGIDVDPEWYRWTTEEVRERYRLVRDFDKTVQKCRKKFVEFVEQEFRKHKNKMKIR